MNKKLLEYFGNDSLAASVWEGKYKYKDEETPKDMHRRMSKEFYRIDKKYQEDEPADKNKLSEYGQKRKNLTEESIFNYFDRFKWIVPQGSVMAGLGTEDIVSLSNCVVIPSVMDSYGGIMYTDTQLAQLFKRRCVSDDSVVITKGAGITKINNVKVGDYILGRDNINNRDDYYKITDIFKTEVKKDDRIIITLSNGIEIKTSKNHPILTFSNNGYNYINAGDLVKGDVLIKPDKKETNYICHGDELQTDIAWFIGCHLGDGSAGWVKNTCKKSYGEYIYNRVRFRINGDNKDVIENYARVHKNISSSKTNIFISKRKDYKVDVWEYWSSIKDNEDIINKYFDGKVGNKTYNSQITSFVVNNNLFIPFISGLIDSDGYVKDGGTISISLTNYNLINEISSYLSLIGIYYHVGKYKSKRKNEHTQYRLNIHYNEIFFKSICKFMKHGSKKEKLLHYTNVNHSKKYFISNDEYEQILTEYQKIRWNNVSNNTRVCVSKLKRDKKIGLAGIVSFYEDKLIDIRKKNEIEQRVYVERVEPDLHSQNYIDLAVKTVNNFYSGNFGVVNIHNCGVGFDLSNLRPNTAPVQNSAKTTSGAVSFMERFSNTVRETSQAGRRKK